MKTFYTDHDIEDMAKAGTREIEIDDDVVLTDLAREKALSIGIKLRQKHSAEPVVATGRPLIRPLSAVSAGGSPSPSPAPAAAPSRPVPDPPTKPLAADSSPAAAIPASQSSAAGSLSEEEFKRRVKSVLVGRLGSRVPEAMIDAAIVKVLKEDGSP
jgi:hypothetical protein